MKPFILILFVFAKLSSSAQTVINSDFSSGTSGWACSAEVNSETVYGGTTSNLVCEVDQQAGLCQTINGFTVGQVYTLSLKYSRRVGSCPSPNPSNVSVTLSGGAVTATISSSVSSFSFQTAVYTFTASQTTLSLTVNALFSGTCGLILDDIVIAPYSTLPVELVYFNANAAQPYDIVEWQTASERNNESFAVQRSTDAFAWQTCAVLPGKGNTWQATTYFCHIKDVWSGTTYYRLLQRDIGGAGSYSAIVSTERLPGQSVTVFPNPASRKVWVSVAVGVLSKAYAVAVNGSWIELTLLPTDSGAEINIASLSNGSYVLRLVTKDSKIYNEPLQVVNESAR